MDTLFIALRVAVSLAVVLGIIWYAQRRLSRGSRAKQNQAVVVVGRQGIGAKASVAVVEMDGKRFLLGVTDQAVTILHTADAPVAPAEAFSRVLESEGGDAAALTAPTVGRSSALAGSLLSADTWRRAFASLRP